MRSEEVRADASQAQVCLRRKTEIVLSLPKIRYTIHSASIYVIRSNNLFQGSLFEFHCGVGGPDTVAAPVDSY
ncbi:hypothetical protein DFQ15_11156 [Xylophilus ampelinus]|uniref:Uncharacterized protein n=2 Tax=Xylophilus ampelinus TaxID=54067 RepID=A0A318SGK3_9BURK|nr:hypothetical protein DFQ15_11156 [Xylophilus ampelinus]